MSSTTILPTTRVKEPVVDNSGEGVVVSHETWFETVQSASVFQKATYASFILAFCLAGFAGIVLYRKSLKTKVFRFSMGAKVLAVAFFCFGLISFFSAYLFNNYLNGADINAPVICSMLIWVLVGPAIAVILNSLLTREDSPGKMKMLLDVFVYLIIFGCVVASMAPGIDKNTAIIFSFLGLIFFAIPIVRFLTALRFAKVRHPEVREVFIQNLIYALLFLPMLLPGLGIANVYEMIDSELKLFLINFIIISFILISGLLMMIAIDFVTQGINPNKLINTTPEPFKPNPVIQDWPPGTTEPIGYDIKDPGQFTSESGTPKPYTAKPSQPFGKQEPVPYQERPSAPKERDRPAPSKDKKTSDSERISNPTTPPKPAPPPKSPDPNVRIKPPGKPKPRY